MSLKPRPLTRSYEGLRLYNPCDVWQWALFIDPRAENNLAEFVGRQRGADPTKFTQFFYPRSIERSDRTLAHNAPAREGAGLSVIYFTTPTNAEQWEKIRADMLAAGWGAEQVNPKFRTFVRADKNVGDASRDRRNIAKSSGAIERDCSAESGAGDGINRVYIFDAGVWFQEGADEYDCNIAFAQLCEQIGELTRRWYDGEYLQFAMRRTPAASGVALMALLMPRAAEYPILSPFHSKILTEKPTPQYRQEIFKTVGDLEHFYTYDFVKLYDQCIHYGTKPLGEPLLIVGDEFHPYRPAWYEISATVPPDWNHVGIVYCNGAWPRNPGETFTTWISEIELRIVLNLETAGAPIRSMRRAANLPNVNQDWSVKIHKRLEFGYDFMGNDVACTLEKTHSKWGYTLDDLERQCTHSPALINHAVRAIRYQAIGALHPGAGRQHQMTRADFDALPKDNIVGFHVDAKTKNVVVDFERAASGIVAPQLSQWIWATARSFLTRAALSAPFETIIGMSADQIYTTAPLAIAVPNNVARWGDIRQKGFGLDGPIPSPRDIKELSILHDASAAETVQAAQAFGEQYLVVRGEADAAHAGALAGTQGKHRAGVKAKGVRKAAPASKGRGQAAYEAALMIESAQNRLRAQNV